jgi:16S rRNA U516 pseudouridylate synthase RsuA-like enzyme
MTRFIPPEPITLAQHEQVKRMAAVLGARVDALSRERAMLRQRLRAVILAGKRYRSTVRTLTRDKPKGKR